MFFYRALRYEDIAVVSTKKVSREEFDSFVETREMDRRWDILYDKTGKGHLIYRSREGYIEYKTHWEW